jgi:S1-C subfamily serine protease
VNDRFTRGILVVVAVVLALFVARPYLDRVFFAASTPRAVEPRGQLSDIERSTVELFERVSPSVVQVVGQAAAAPDFAAPEEGGGGQSGTGFVWDAAGHIVTNNHVVEGARELGVRFASGEAVRATVVGLAPNYDLAVIHVGSSRQLPPPVSVGSSADLQVGKWHSRSEIRLGWTSR